MDNAQNFNLKIRYKIYFVIAFPLMIATTLFYIKRDPKVLQKTTGYIYQYKNTAYKATISYMTDSSIHSYVILKGKPEDSIRKQKTKKYSVVFEVDPYGQIFEIDKPNSLVLVTKDKAIIRHVENLKSQIDKYKDHKYLDNLFKNLK